MEWISVKDKLPAVDVHVLFVAPFDGQPLVCYGYKPNDDPESFVWFDLTTTDRDGEPLDVYGVTHWMPLPPPPRHVLP